MDSSNSSSNSSLFDQAAYLRRILPSVLAMSILFVLSAVGNLTVFLKLATSRRRKSRISVIIMHLTIADLFVTFVLIPTEIVWRLLRFWVAGNALCKVFAFSRAFGAYLSSMVLIVVSLDRYIAIRHPLSSNSEFARRGTVMLQVAWIMAALCSLPQAFVWQTMPSPTDPGAEQCVTFGTDPLAVKGFTLFFLITVYFVPLLIMVIAYSRIISAIVTQSELVEPEQRLRHPPISPRPSKALNIPAMNAPSLVSPARSPNANFLRRDNSVSRRSFTRAKVRTLRMTVAIVVAFILCWTPNVVMSFWFLIDRQSALKMVDPRLADVLFILTLTNSVVNPYVYGSYASEMRSIVTCLNRKRTGNNNAASLNQVASLNHAASLNHVVSLRRLSHRQAISAHADLDRNDAIQRGGARCRLTTRPTSSRSRFLRVKPVQQDFSAGSSSFSSHNASSSCSLAPISNRPKKVCSLEIVPEQETFRRNRSRPFQNLMKKTWTAISRSSSSFLVGNKSENSAEQSQHSSRRKEMRSSSMGEITDRPRTIRKINYRRRLSAKTAGQDAFRRSF